MTDKLKQAETTTQGGSVTLDKHGKVLKRVKPTTDRDVQVDEKPRTAKEQESSQ